MGDEPMTTLNTYVLKKGEVNEQHQNISESIV
jgi:hypothetical protein